MSAAPGGQEPKLRTFHHSAYTPERIAAERQASVSVCLPARECAASIEPIVRALLGLREQGVLDEVVVLDAASHDGTAAIARRAGARVLQESELLEGFGPVLGKGDAMWRALDALEGELVCFLDADTEAFCAHFATGVLGALICEPGVSFVKGYYRRPLSAQGGTAGEGGGRVNHLLARPALSLFYPELSDLRQPLGGEVAASAELLRSLPFTTGYGVEIAMVIDAWRAVGLGGLAQVDLDEHRNPHKPLSALEPMARTVLATIARRLEEDGRLTIDAADGAGPGGEAPVERPPLAALAEAA